MNKILRIILSLKPFKYLFFSVLICFIIAIKFQGLFRSNFTPVESVATLLVLVGINLTVASCLFTYAQVLDGTKKDKIVEKGETFLIVFFTQLFSILLFWVLLKFDPGAIQTYPLHNVVFVLSLVIILTLQICEFWELLMLLFNKKMEDIYRDII